MLSPTVAAPHTRRSASRRPTLGGQTVIEDEDLRVRAFRTSSVGNWSYLVVSGDEAALIDPQRDVERFLGGLSRGAPPVGYVFETHVHSDYLSGATRLAQWGGTEIVGSQQAHYAFPHRAIQDGTGIRIGAIELRAMGTPGHTREHVAWSLIRDGQDDPMAVFSGGSLIAGGAGRTDIVGSGSVPLLTWLQFQSVRRVADLPDDTLLLPTHGGGSVCGTSGDEETAAAFRTVGEERARNPLLGLGYDAFRDALVKNRPPVPASFRSIARLNRLGPPTFDPPGAPWLLPAAEFATEIATGAWPIDLRGRREFAERHIRGSLNFEPTDAFLTQLGALVPHGVPLVLVADTGDERWLPELVVDCYRIGYAVSGVLGGGIGAWQADGRAVESYPVTTAVQVREELRRRDAIQLLDVRDASEWSAGAVSSSELVSLGRLAASAQALAERLRPDEPLTVVCRGGARAAVAASYLARRGMAVRPVIDGGVPDLLASGTSA
jgi:hydroxyacylglutathione hydrolase